MVFPEMLQHYARHDTLTDPAGFAGLFDDLPAVPSVLRDVVSGLIVHVSWTAQYGIPPEMPLTRETKAVADRLDETQRASGGSLLDHRPPLRRTFGTCRDFALLLCSALRHRSIPARIRCGFATYFASRRYADHWVCEYWIAEEGRWAMADAQLDQLQRDHLSIGFDCADLPGGAFLAAPSAWALVRAGAADPGEFGHGDAGGLWFLRVNLFRDLLALANCHMSAWDTWRTADEPSRVLSDETLTECDRVAELVTVGAASGRLAELQAMAMGRLVPPWHQSNATCSPDRWRAR
jgi:hypothetical protein